MDMEKDDTQYWMAMLEVSECCSTHIRCRRMRVDEYDVVIFPGLNQRLHASFRQ